MLAGRGWRGAELNIMHTVTAMLVFPSEIGYSGAVHLLPWRLATGCPATLKVFVQNLAEEFSAQAAFHEEGTYERWAE